MITTDPLVVNTIKNFKERCLVQHDFSLPAIYPEFVLENIDAVFIDSVIKFNNLDFAGSFTTVKYFIKFLNVLQEVISNELGSDYRVKVFHSLDYMDWWEYFEHKFILDEHNTLIKIRDIE